MSEETETDAMAYDSIAALQDVRIMWLKLGRVLSAWAEVDHIDDPKWADESIAMIARAEACLWRATGEADAIDIERFLSAPKDAEQ